MFPKKKKFFPQWLGLMKRVKTWEVGRMRELKVTPCREQGQLVRFRICVGLAIVFLSACGRESASSLGPSLKNEADLEDDFETAPLGVVTAPYLQEKWKANVQAGVKEGRFAVEKEGDNHFLRVLYPAGLISPRNSGGQWVAALPACVEAEASYRVRFEAGFDWTTGGKLPGLAGGTMPTGGHARTDGFSARYMWKQEGGLILYLYHAEQKDKYGDGLRLGSGILRPGMWHTLRQRVRLNTPGQSNGELQVWFDGKLVLDRSNMRWRQEGANWKIDHFLFSTFHGGASEDYRPSRDNHVDFDDFRVSGIPGG